MFNKFKNLNLKFFIIIILNIFLLYPNVSHGALKLKNSVDLEKGYNPNPMFDDIILPMPCNLSMIFRIIAVPSQGFLWDMPTRFGRDDTEQERGYYDSRYNTALSAPFRLEDLPLNWQTLVPQGDYNYYLMSKYEVSTLQWSVIMDENAINQCPSASAENVRPMTEISWYDAVEFTEKYSTWLLNNAPENLPHFAEDTRNVGFVRLPTEVEWEYAARAGHTNSGQNLREEDFFPMDNDLTYANYAVFRPEDAVYIEESPLRIGSRKPNGAGLYDTAGNVAEMVIDTFRFSLGGRLHGSAGGFVRKGGSFLSSTAQIMPGRREEVAFFQSNGVVKSRDLGFRLALSGINTPGGQRPQILLQEWEKAGENNSVLFDNTQNPLTEIDKLLEASTDENQAENYKRLRNVIKDNNIALERHQNLAAQSEVRTMAFLIESIRNFNMRISIANIYIKNNEKTITALKKQKNSQANLKKVTEARDKYIKLKNKYTLGMEQSIILYKTKLYDTQNIAQNILDKAIINVQNDLRKNDDFSSDLYGNIQLFSKHLSYVRRNEHAKLTKEQLQKDILK